MQIFWRIGGETFGDSVRTVTALAIIAKLHLNRRKGLFDKIQKVEMKL